MGEIAKMKKAFENVPVFQVCDEDQKYLKKVLFKSSTAATVSITALKIAEKAAEEATKKILSCAAKAGFAGGIFVELMSFFMSLYIAKGQRDKGEISEEEFHQFILKRLLGGTGAVAGSTVGAIVGTWLIPFPVVGTFVGSLVGGCCADLIGSMIATEISRVWFKKNN